jgi:hypothetical protein
MEAPPAPARALAPKAIPAKAKEEPAAAAAETAKPQEQEQEEAVPMTPAPAAAAPPAATTTTPDAAAAAPATTTTATTPDAAAAAAPSSGPCTFSDLSTRPNVVRIWSTMYLSAAVDKAAKMLGLLPTGHKEQEEEEHAAAAGGGGGEFSEVHVVALGMAISRAATVGE